MSGGSEQRLSEGRMWGNKVKLCVWRSSGGRHGLFVLLKVFSHTSKWRHSNELTLKNKKGFQVEGRVTPDWLLRSTSVTSIKTRKMKNGLQEVFDPSRQSPPLTFPNTIFDHKSLRRPPDSISRVHFNLSRTEITPNQTPRAPWQGKQTNNCSRRLKTQRSTWRKKTAVLCVSHLFQTKPEEDQKGSFIAETEIWPKYEQVHVHPGRLFCSKLLVRTAKQRTE